MKVKIPRFFVSRLLQSRSFPSIVIPSAARDLLLLALALVGSLALCFSAGPQQAKTSDLASLQAYSTAREGSLVGTVVKYDPASSTPPPGAHVLVQTASGQVDVHLGNPKLLEVNHLQLNPGDSVRIVGENVALGESTYFAARILQKGNQAVTLRSVRGFPARAVAANSSNRQGGVL